MQAFKARASSKAGVPTPWVQYLTQRNTLDHWKCPKLGKGEAVLSHMGKGWGQQPCSLPPDASVGHGVEGLAGDVAGEYTLCLLRDALVECDIEKLALRPFLCIFHQGGSLPSAWDSNRRSDPLPSTVSQGWRPDEYQSGGGQGCGTSRV